MTENISFVEFAELREQEWFSNRRSFSSRRAFAARLVHHQQTSSSQPYLKFRSSGGCGVLLFTIHHALLGILLQKEPGIQSTEISV